MPSACYVCREGPKKPWQSLSTVRGCQNCLRSLEPISILSNDLPLPELWPVLDYQENNAPNNGYHSDTHGRMQCVSCHAIFCSKACKDVHNERMGACCNCTLSVNAVIHALHVDQNLSGGGTDDEVIELQPATILATRAYVNVLHRYRASGELTSGPLECLCGSANDMSPLELGYEEEEVDESTQIPVTIRYTLRSAYEAMCDALCTTDKEKQYLPLEFFHRLAAVAARNGFAIKTRSPFRAYHAALLRAVGGRGTDRHVEMMKQVATALGSKDGTLHRDMDRKVEERVCLDRCRLLWTSIYSY